MILQWPIKHALLVITVLISDGLFCQEYPDANHDQHEIRAESSIGKQIDQNTIGADLIDEPEHRFNLNSTKDVQVLVQEGIISLVEAEAIKVHIQKFGKLLHVNELLVIDNFTSHRIDEIMPHVRVNSTSDHPTIRIKSLFPLQKTEAVFRYGRTLENQTGYVQKKYIGSPNHYFFRIRSKINQHFSAGISIEKDPGEAFWNTQKAIGFDFLTAHCFVQNMKWIKALAIGDFHAQFGQGLTFWSGRAMGKSAIVLNIKRSRTGLKPFTSVDENNFLRGVGTTLRWRNVTYSSFISHKKIDANLDTILGGNEVLRNQPTSGLHRTSSEISTKDRAHETIIGGNVQWALSNFELGVTGVQTIVGRSSYPIINSRLVHFDRSSAVGINYETRLQNLVFFGESTVCNGQQWATFNGFTSSLDPKLSVVGYHRFLGHSFGRKYIFTLAESSRQENEEGMYLGLEFLPTHAWKISAYVDLFKFRNAKFGMHNTNTRRHGILVQTLFHPSKSTKIYFRLRSNKKERTIHNKENKIPTNQTFTKHNYRLNFDYKVNNQFQLRSRIEVSSIFSPEVQQGTLFYQDFIYSSPKNKVSIRLRYALFDCPSWDSRIYSYEANVSNFNMIPAYAGKGSRFYIKARIKLSKSLQISARWAQWYYADRNKVGNGLQSISGNQKQTLSFQAKWNL